MYRSIACALALLIGALPLAGNAGIITLEATIDGAQANAGNGTGSLSEASATMTYDTGSNTLTWMIGEVAPFFTSDMRFAHFHGAAGPDANAAVQVWICDNLAVGPAGTPVCGGAGEKLAQGTATLSDAQAADLLAGLWYINIHTVNFPGGEIRGQVARVPEPAVPALLGAGLVVLGALRRRRMA